MEFKEGMRIEHVSHGEGIVVDVDKFDLDSITVEFDIEPEGWENPLRVSKNCSKIIIPKIEINLDSVKKIADQINQELIVNAKYDAENKELTVKRYLELEELDQKHIDWLNGERK